MGQLLPDMEFRRFGEVKKENDFGQRADRLKTYYNKASGLYYKHITSVNDDSSVDNKFEASLTGNTRRNGQPPKSQLTKKSTCQKVNLSIK